MKRKPFWLIIIATLLLLYATPPAYSSEFIVRTVEEDQVNPAIAFNSDADEFLVVWEDYVWQSIGTLGIAAQRIGVNGTLIGESFPAVGEWFFFRSFQNPDIVYNPSANEYLLVWEYEQSSDDHHIYARRLSSTGAAIGSDHIHIADTSKFESNPQVAYNSTDNEYLIIWEHRNVDSITTGSGTIDIIQNDIHGQRVSSNGSVLGSPIVITNGSLDQSTPSVAFGSTNGQYLVVWQDTQSTGETDIYGQRIGRTGALAGGKIAISTWEYNQVKPRLAYNNKANEFLILWEDHHWGWGDARDIYAQRVNGSGILQGANFAVAWEGDDLLLNPDVAYNPNANEYLAAWEYEEYYGDSHIYQRRVSSNGTLIGDEVMVSNQSTSQTHPAIAPDDTSYMIVWEDGRNSATMGIDLYGDLIKLQMLTGHVYVGNIGDESTPLSNVALDLYCSNNAGQLGNLLSSTVTDSNGSYSIMLDNVCEYYNITEKDPTGYISTGAASVGGRVINDNWIELTHPLSVSEMSDNDFWDIADLPPGNWSTFSPTDWLTSQTVTCTVQIEDTGSGLDVSTAQYAYDNNSSWSSWQAASCTGSDGTIAPQTITTSNVPFGTDSTTTHPNRIKFRITDMSGSMAESPFFTVSIDTTGPTNPALSADHDTGIWLEDATIVMSWSGASDASSGVEKYFYQWSTSPTTVPDETLSTTTTSLSTTIPAEGSNSYFHLITVDSAGNRAATAVHLGPFYLDTGPPEIISGPTVSSLTQYSALISWQTSEDSDSVLHYSKTAGRYTLQETDASLVTDHSISLTNLAPSTTYRLMVQSTDASGKKAESRGITFETLALTDNTNPTVSLIDPGVFRGTVTISANASDDKGVEKVAFFLNDDLVFTAYGPPYVLTMDTIQYINGEYTLKATAYDHSGRHAIDERIIQMLNIVDETAPSVTITSPDHDGAVVSGKVNVIASLSDDTGLGQAYFRVNGKWESLKPLPSHPKSKTVTFEWDTTSVSVANGSYTLAVEAYDIDKPYINYGYDTRQVIVNQVPPALPPKLKVTHDVTRHNNYFAIDMSVENVGDETAENIEIQDFLRGFQPISCTFTTPVHAKYEAKHDSYKKEWECVITSYEDIPGMQSRTYTYFVVPVLFDTNPPTPEIGYLTGLHYDKDPSGFRIHDWFAVPVPKTWGANGKSIPEAYDEALSEADYLIVTNPVRLFAFGNTQTNAVYGLLSDMAELARYKNGALGYMETYDKNLFRKLIKPAFLPFLNIGQWSSKLKSNWASDGYLLIVGETGVIPAWSKVLGTHEISTGGTYTWKADPTDYPYASTYGEELKPELSIGRIIGDNPTALRKPIQTSINVIKGLSGYGFDRSHSLLISGFPKGLSGKSMNIKTKAEVDNVLKEILKKPVSPISVQSVWHTPSYTKYGSTGGMDENATKNAIKQAFFADTPDIDTIFLAGHGNLGHWDGIHKNDIINQTNPFGSTNPFVFASSCLTGKYTGGSQFAEAFLEKGAGAYLGATEKGACYQGQVCPNADKFFQKWDLSESLGLALKQTKRSLSNDITHRIWSGIYHLYGDPKFGALASKSAKTANSLKNMIRNASSIEIVVPDYEVTPINGDDFVRIPGGYTLYKSGMPLVPYYRVFYDYPKGYQIQDVLLNDRSDKVTESGLNIPKSVLGVLGCCEPYLENIQQGIPEWWPEKIFEWTVFESPDTTTLAISIFPFYYNCQTNVVEFYRDYSFDINYAVSDTEIVNIQTDKDVYVQGDSIVADMILENTGTEAKDIVVSLMIQEESSGENVINLPLHTLKDFSGRASWSCKSDSSGLQPGYYRIYVQLMDTEGKDLDRKIETFRLGIISGEITDFSVTPEYFDIGDSINTSLTFSNTGTIDITGTAVINVNNGAGDIAQEFTHDIVDLTPNSSITFDDTWDTSEAQGGSYQIDGHVLFDGMATAPMINNVSSLSQFDGDVAPLGNRDGIVNVGDALVALRFALGLEIPTQEDMGHGDVAPLDAGGQPDPDGVINVGDALVILRKALGIIGF